MEELIRAMKEDHEAFRQMLRTLKENLEEVDLEIDARTMPELISHEELRRNIFKLDEMLSAYLKREEEELFPKVLEIEKRRPQ